MSLRWRSGGGLCLVGFGLALSQACVFTPATPTKPTTASIGQVQLVVPRLEGASSASVQAWHRIRLTLGREDGATSDLSRVIKARKGLLQPPTPIRELPIGATFWGRVELIEETGADSERVVGRGYLAEGSVKLQGGRNDLRFLVGPTAAGALLATTASESLEERQERLRQERKDSGRDEGEDDDLLGSILGGVISGTVTKGSPSPGPSGSGKKAVAEEPTPEASPATAGKRAGGLILLSLPE